MEMLIKSVTFLSKSFVFVSPFYYLLILFSGAQMFGSGVSLEQERANLTWLFSFMLLPLLFYVPLILGKIKFFGIDSIWLLVGSLTIILWLSHLIGYNHAAYNHVRGLKNQLDYQEKDGEIYYNGRHVDADKKTFQYIDNIYAKDKSQVFYTYKVLSGADVGSFQKLDDHHLFAIDKNRVYRDGKVVHDIDRKSLTFLKTSHYSKDKDRVYYYLSSRDFIDGDTLKLIEGEYAKDKNNVYYRGDIVTGADLDSFEVSDKDHELGRDENYDYWGTKRIPKGKHGERW